MSEKMKREKGHADLVPPNQNGPFYFDPLQGGSPKDQFIAAQSWEETNKIGPDEASERASSEQESARENQFREYVKDLVRDAGAVLRKTEQIARAPQAWKRTNVEALRSELKEFETRSKEAAPTKDEVEELKAKVRQLEEELKEVEERQMSTWTKMNPFGGTQREKFEQDKKENAAEKKKEIRRAEKELKHAEDQRQGVKDAKEEAGRLRKKLTDVEESRGLEERLKTKEKDTRAALIHAYLLRAFPNVGSKEAKEEERQLQSEDMLTVMRLAEMSATAEGRESLKTANDILIRFEKEYDRRALSDAGSNVFVIEILTDIMNRIGKKRKMDPSAIEVESVDEGTIPGEHGDYPTPFGSIRLMGERVAGYKNNPEAGVDVDWDRLGFLRAVEKLLER